MAGAGLAANQLLNWLGQLVAFGVYLDG